MDLVVSKFHVVLILYNIFEFAPFKVSLIVLHLTSGYVKPAILFCGFFKHNRAVMWREYVA
jgi:hypothetical protein